MKHTTKVTSVIHKQSIKI